MNALAPFLTTITKWHAHTHKGTSGCRNETATRGRVYAFWRPVRDRGRGHRLPARPPPCCSITASIVSPSSMSICRGWRPTETNGGAKRSRRHAAVGRISVGAHARQAAAYAGSATSTRVIAGGAWQCAEPSLDSQPPLPVFATPPPQDRTTMAVAKCPDTYRCRRFGLVNALAVKGEPEGAGHDALAGGIGLEDLAELGAGLHLEGQLATRLRRCAGTGGASWRGRRERGQPRQSRARARHVSTGRTSENAAGSACCAASGLAERCCAHATMARKAPVR